MQPVIWDDKIVRGDGFRLGFRPAHLNESVNPPVTVYDYNFTGWTGKAQLRKTVDAATVELEFTIEIPNQITTPGLVWITATGAQTALLTEDSGVYDLQMTPSAGQPMTIARGKLTLIRDVTRP